MINRKQISEKHFVSNEDGSVYLNGQGKRLFIEAFDEKMNSKLSYDGVTVNYNQLIEQEIRKYLKHILEDDYRYKPYKYY